MISRLGAAICGLLVATSVCWAEDPDPNAEGLSLEYLESWIVLEEEAAPEPPLVRLDVGFVAYIEVESSTRVDRRGITGTDMDDLEEEQGLDSSGVGPWIELSIGGKVRGGVEASFFSRGGDFEVQDEEIVFDGVQVAEPGDIVEARMDFLTLTGFVEWDALYGKTYRIGMLAGLRYFRLEQELTGVRSGLRPTKITERVRGELISPFFGGLAELTPFPYLTVFTRVQFIIWSWDAVDLKESRYLQFRLGASLNPIPDVLSITSEFRFLVVRARSSGSGRRYEGAISAVGLAITLGLRF